MPLLTRPDLRRSAPPRAPEAVLWDLDGTIVDSEPHWLAAGDALLAAFGAAALSLSEQNMLVGAALDDSANFYQGRGVELDASEIIIRLSDTVVWSVARDGHVWRPGAREALTGLRAGGVRVALVTMSHRRTAEQVLESLPAGLFETVVTGEEVARGKPSPDAYLTALDRLGLDAAKCVAVEDSLHGVAAAEAAGIHVIGVPHHLDLADSAAHTVWPTLEGRTAADFSVLS